MARSNPLPVPDRKKANPSETGFDGVAKEAQNSRWPFAEGSQNNLDEVHAPWPRPWARTSTATPPRRPGQ
ncbi:MAG TPA: hypothetical protein VE934_06475 [Polaromonas sp.]|uniref:hypothetical protein n=1 Tax=Polaromonas sp. TaxID=1869339 RepID=UPI002D6D2409|nr:hypothetical protein [Polaromonas sp.]HYW56584.1 hypothetical protein [Polaromonas sp.]